MKGRIVSIHSGSFTVTQPVAVLEQPDGSRIELTMMQKWPVRVGRPYRRKFPPATPLQSGQRIVDTFFPVAKGTILLRNASACHKNSKTKTNMINYNTRFRVFQVNGCQGCSKIRVFLASFCRKSLKNGAKRPGRHLPAGPKDPMCSVFRKPC